MGRKEGWMDDGWMDGRWGGTQEIRNSGSVIISKIFFLHIGENF